jgi:hypothetical protein
MGCESEGIARQAKKGQSFRRLLFAPAGFQGTDRPCLRGVQENVEWAGTGTVLLATLIASSSNNSKASF